MKLQGAKLPGRMSPVFDISGLILVPDTQEKWQAHHIIRGQPRGQSEWHGDFKDETWRTELAGQHLVSLRRQHDDLSPQPLDEHSANHVNATLWWIYNGKFEGRFVSLAELSGE